MLITMLAGLTVQTVEIRIGSVVEQRIELAPLFSGGPIVSLDLDEAMALSQLIRNRVREAVAREYQRRDQEQRAA